MNTKAMLLCVLAAVAVVHAAPGRVLLGNRSVFPSEYERVGAAYPGEQVNFMLLLKQRNVEAFQQRAMEISTPGSKLYRQFMTREEVLDMVAPAADEQDKVLTWLAQNGVAKNKVLNLGDAVQVQTTVEVASELFNANLHAFRHRETGRRFIVIMGQFSVPEGLVIEAVDGITGFVPNVRLSAKKATNANMIVPQTVQQSYGVPTSMAPVAGNNGLGMWEYEGQSFSPSDLASYAQSFNVKIPALSSDHIIGNNQPSSAGTEAELDVQVGFATGQGVTPWFWLFDQQDWLLSSSIQFFNAKDVPATVSISYGWNAADQCQQGIGGNDCQKYHLDSEQFVGRVNTEFSKIAARGVSMFCASGDSGANGRTDEGCSETHLNPSFPASSPWITAVGATQLTDTTPLTKNVPPACSSGQISCVSGGTEQAVSYNQAHFASGGGFSIYSARPSYQSDAVAAYLKQTSKLPPSGYYNATNRGFPDIAAFGSAIAITVQGRIEGVGGTSASSPIVAGVASLLNDAAIQKDGKPLGFLNPLLYKAAAECTGCFTDITVGDNKCTEQGCGIFGNCKGFECATGWDPVTGLGSPKYEALLNYVQNQL
eukprot:TRINITY_DN59138_c0_g1_i2.p1 TRINITY_DN59138_c0_g1~~TRINITY_DN59138_c0_g1_i2.p1  ORF type:complete len:628 (+),score=323.17 TRINITY_DN59138_c0_g1_i2:94-1884(+)